MAVTTEREYGLFIDGELREPESGEMRELVEPATGQPLGRAAMAGEADVDRAVAAARSALDGAWSKTPPTERSRLLHALADAIVANRAELVELEARNVGKAVSSVKAELYGAAENFRFYASAIASIAGRSNPIGGSLLFYSLKEPVGVCGQIVPWNYPLLMATWKLAPALAAGCTIVLKPDAQTPLTAIRLAELATEVGFPAGVVNVLPGDGPTTGAAIVRHPGVDKVAFTGSTATGGEIMRLASIRSSASRSSWAGRARTSSSPTPTWPTRFRAPSGRSTTRPGRAARPARGCSWRSRSTTSSWRPSPRRHGQLKVGDPLDPETQMGSLISEAHRARVHGFVERGTEEGAEVVAGGSPADGPGAFYPPTVLAGVGNSWPSPSRRSSGRS